MLNLDQVRLLENRVEKAVGKIQSLTSENTLLRTQLTGLQTRVSELEGLVRSFKDDQGRIEEGILNALDRLSAFEDSVFHAESTAAPVVESTSAPAAETHVEPSIPVPPAEEIVIEEPAPETEAETVGQIDIEAEWQNTKTENTSPDGQMDIF